MKVIAYLRVSTVKQVKDGYGKADQEKQIRAWCRQHNHKLVRIVYDDAQSGTLPAQERPGLLEVLKAIRGHEADGVIMRDLDRIARTLTVQEAVLAQLWKLGGRAYVVTSAEEIPQDDPDDPARTAMRQMMGVFAQLERAMIIKRMRNGRQAKADDGGYAYGAPAFGQKAEGRALVTDDTEAATVARMRQLRAEGLSYRLIAAQLNAEGLKAKHGATWYPMTVKRVLDR